MFSVPQKTMNLFDSRISAWFWETSTIIVPNVLVYIFENSISIRRNLAKRWKKREVTLCLAEFLESVLDSTSRWLFSLELEKMLKNQPFLARCRFDSAENALTEAYV